MDRDYLLKEAVKSILDQTIYPDELIVVDAGLKEKNLKHKVESILEKRIPFKYYHTSPSTSFQRNYGAEKAFGDIVLFMDDDIVLETSHIEQLLGFYNSREYLSFSGLMGILIDEHINQQNIIFQILRRLFLLQETRRDDTPGKMKKSGFARFSLSVDNLTRIDVAPSGCISFWREIFLKYLFDTSFSGYVLAEDKDLSWRISRDLPLYQSPHIKFMHRDNSPPKKVDLYLKQKKWFLMHYHFFKKNFSGRFINYFAFLWASLGYAIFFTLIGIRSKSFVRLNGFLAGFFQKR